MAEKDRKSIRDLAGEAVRRAASRAGGMAAFEDEEEIDPAIQAAAESVTYGGTGGRYRLPPTQTYPGRTVTSAMPGFEGELENVTYPRPDFESMYGMTPREAAGLRPGIDFLSTPLYSGQNLVNEEGVIERAPYNLSTSEEVNGVLSELSDSDRRTLLNFLYAKGFYDTESGPTATGLSSRDQQAVAKLLFVANIQGVTWRLAMDYVANNPLFTNPNISASGAGGRRIPPEEELRLVMTDATHRMLGRAPTPGEVARYIDIYKSGNLSPTSAAEVAVERTAGPEEEAYGFAQMAQLLSRLLGG